MVQISQLINYQDCLRVGFLLDGFNINVNINEINELKTKKLSS